jgi:hypothetical protein
MKKLVSLSLLIIISGCSLITDEYQDNQRKVIDYLLGDVPMPEDAEIIQFPTAIQGTGQNVSGRIVLSSQDSPAENLIFYDTQAPIAGWMLVSSKAGEEVVLVYEKGNRVISINMVPRNTFAGFFKGDVGSIIDISLKN